MAGASLEYRVAFSAIHAVLVKEWDPIGVSDEPMAQDEYDFYIPGIYRLLVEGANDATIAEHLAQIETQQIGLSSREDRNLRVASLLRAAMSRT